MCDNQFDSSGILRARWCLKRRFRVAPSLVQKLDQDSPPPPPSSSPTVGIVPEVIYYCSVMYACGVHKVDDMLSVLGRVLHIAYTATRKIFDSRMNVCFVVRRDADRVALLSCTAQSVFL